MPRTASAPTLEQQISTLQTEVADFEAELHKTQTALDELLQPKVNPQNNTPTAIAQAALKATELRAKNQPKIDGLKQAVEELQNWLQSGRQTLSQLQQQQATQVRQEKMQAASAAVRTHIQRIQAASASLEFELWELKVTWQEHREAFINGQSNPYAGMGQGYRWQPTELVEFGFTNVPELVEQSGGFRLQARQVGLFNAELQQQRAEELAQLQERSQAKQRQEQESKRQRWTGTIEDLQNLLAATGQQLEQAPDGLTTRRIEADIKHIQQQIQEHEALLTQLDESSTIEPSAS